MRGQKIQKRPGGRLNRHIGEEAMSADGTTLATASLQVLPHVTANPERPSSHLNRSVRDPSGSGSAMMMARGLAGVEKILLGGFFTDGAACLLYPGGRGRKIMVLVCERQVIDFSGEGDGVTLLVQLSSPHLRFLALG
jgi:hypothetical protein